MVEDAGPASLLVAIELRMSDGLRARVPPEDVLQEVLLQAWRDRDSFEWRGPRSFRAWLLTLIDHRIRDAAEREGALKRGAGITPVPLGPRSDESTYAGPVATTTPSRVAMHREEAAALRAALAGLPDEYRDVVRLRLFELKTVEQIAAQLRLTVAAVRHRFRHGSALYKLRLGHELSLRPATVSARFATMHRPDTA